MLPAAQKKSSEENRVVCGIDSSFNSLTAHLFLSMSPSIPFSFAPFQVNLRNSEHLSMMYSLKVLLGEEYSVLVYTLLYILLSASYQMPLSLPCTKQLNKCLK